MKIFKILYYKTIDDETIELMLLTLHVITVEKLVVKRSGRLDKLDESVCIVVSELDY